MKLKISEIFYSIQGEGVDMGIPTIFLRLFGCNLRCTWCDSMYAVEGKEYKIMKIENIIREIELIDCKRICNLTAVFIFFGVNIVNITSVFILSSSFK